MEIEESIFWIGHASFYIKTNAGNVFIDPFKVNDTFSEKADLVLVTHDHFDHHSASDIGKVRKPDTKFIAANNCLKGERNLIAVAKPGSSIDFKGVKVTAVPAYNLRDERLKFHPKSENWVGYIIETGGRRIYHAGDTDLIPEMGSLENIDVALLPCGGTYTMSLDEAAKAADRIKPRTVVPMHYKMLLGKEKSEELESNAKSLIGNARIMKEVQSPLYSFE